MKKCFFFFLAILVSTIAFAQDTKVVAGVVNYNSGEFYKAIDNLKTALENREFLKPSNVPKAYYYYGKSLFAEYYRLFEGKSQPDFQYCLKALEAYNNAIKTDDGTWKTKCEQEKAQLIQYLLFAGNEILNSAYSDKNNTSRNALFLNAQQIFNAIVIETPDSYFSYDLLAQTEQALGDSVKAAAHFQKVLSLFESNPPSAPDLYIGYAAYRLSVIERYRNKNYDKALAVIEKGKALVQNEFDRTATKSEQTKSTFTNVINDLSNLELDIYLNVPEKLNAALQKFEKAIQAEPNNYLKHIAYASLLEKSDEAKAIRIYEKAIAINPSDLTAYFNLGAMYNNAAARYSNQAQSESNQDKVKESNRIALDYLGKAYTQFQKAHEINPKETGVLSALMQIAMTLGKDDDFLMYKEKKKALGN